jgi:RNA polymerase sigma factor (sigma-70 family)
MAHPTTPAIVRQLGALFEGGSPAGLSDRQLIERFNHRRDDDDAEAAFAALVARHGQMVLGVCRQLLGDRHLAEDAFQATFLVLARKAQSLRDPDRLATWLYGVALRTARKARTRVTRQHQHEQGDVMDAMADSVIEPTSPPAEQTFLDREQAEALHGEIDRLPGAFRSPIVLCYFEGLTLDEAARRLRCPAGTLRSRLARAREKLRRALTRRGVVLPATALAAALSPRSASASVPPHLCDVTAKAALRFATRQAAASIATTLAHEVLRAMTMHKLITAAATLLLVAALATGAGYLNHPMAIGDEPRQEPAAVQTPATARSDDAAWKPAPGRMFVVGRVLDPAGAPVPNATVGVSMRRKLLFAGIGSEGIHPVPIGQAGSDASGRFRLDAPRASSAQHAEFGAVAVAPGYGLGWADLDPDEDRPSAEIRLMPEQVIEGRLFDVQGRPVPGVLVSVSAIRRALSPIRLAQGHVIEDRSEGPDRWWGRVHDLPGWPKPATTDADGRFTLHGIGRGLHVSLSVLDPRFAPQTIEIATDAPTESKTLKVALQPARAVTGRVTYADTGQPVAHAALRIGAGDRRAVTAEADVEGRFRVSPAPGPRVSVWASPPDGQPYLRAGKTLDWPPGATEQAVDLALPRGVLIRGKVTEEGTGWPVADALVDFNLYARSARAEGNGRARTKADGSFQFPVGPHPGHLSIQAPGEDYQLQVTSNAQLSGGQGTSMRLYAHAFLPYDPGPGTGPPEIRVALRRGATVKFRLIGPDGQPPRDVWVYSRAVLGPAAVSSLRMWWVAPHEVARHGHFEVHGLDPDTEVPVHFLQPDQKLGATARISGMMATQGPVTVRLQPCGVAMARLVGADGKPVTGEPRGVRVMMVVTPGPPPRSAPVRAGALAADEDLLGRVDPVNHGNPLIADAQGRIALPALIPGATYSVRTGGLRGGPPAFRKDFTVKPGETVDLGDILIERPPG